jgi:hypothetical protein
MISQWSRVLEYLKCITCPEWLARRVMPLSRTFPKRAKVLWGPNEQLGFTVRRGNSLWSQLSIANITKASRVCRRCHVTLIKHPLPGNMIRMECSTSACHAWACAIPGNLLSDHVQQTVQFHTQYRDKWWRSWHQITCVFITKFLVKFIICLAFRFPPIIRMHRALLPAIFSISYPQIHDAMCMTWKSSHHTLQVRKEYQHFPSSDELYLHPQKSISKLASPGSTWTEHPSLSL